MDMMMPEEMKKKLIEEMVVCMRKELDTAWRKAIEGGNVAMMRMCDERLDVARWDGLREFLTWRHSRLMESSAREARDGNYNAAECWKQKAIAMWETIENMDALEEWSYVEIAEWRRGSVKRSNDGEAEGQ